LLPKERATYVPERAAGTGTMLCATLATASGPEIESKVISDAYTPGATALTRTGILFNANSVAIIFVRCDAAALALL
jgi:hypothetical protein